jgi:hypothetical protein
MRVPLLPSGQADWNGNGSDPDPCDRQEASPTSGLRWRAPRDPNRISAAGLHVALSHSVGQKRWGCWGRGREAAPISRQITQSNRDDLPHKARWYRFRNLEMSKSGIACRTRDGTCTWETV